MNVLTVVGDLIEGAAIVNVTEDDIIFFEDEGFSGKNIKRPDFLHNAVSYTYFAAQALFALSIYFQ